MRLLVTGAGGQLGHDVVAAADAAGDDVIACRPRRPRRHRPRRRARGASPRCARTRSCNCRGVDGGRRLRGRSGAGVHRQRARRALDRRGLRPGRRPPRARVDRLRLRRHAGPPVPRVGRDRPAVGVRRVEAGRRARGRGARRRRRRWCARRGSAASTARTWSRPSCAWRRDRRRPGRAALAFVDDQRGHPTFTADLAPLLRRLALDRRSRRASTPRTRARCRGTGSSGEVLRGGGLRPGDGAPDLDRRARSAATGAPAGQQRARQRRAAGGRHPAAPRLPSAAGRARRPPPRLAPRLRRF